MITDRAERTLRILADREELTLTWFRYEPGERGPDPHVHRQHTDAFYVLEGELEFGLGPDVTKMSGGAGTFAGAPPNVVHTFANESDATAIFLNIHAPSMGFGDMLRARRDGRKEDVERFDQFEPPADGGRPLDDAVIRGPADADAVSLAGNTIAIKVSAAETEGSLGLIAYTAAPEFPGPPPHIHRATNDMFFVVQGTLTLRLGDDEHEAPPGSFALVPPGNVHTFANRQREPVRFVSIVAPGGFEQYFKDAAEASGDGPPDPRVLAEIASRYDYEPVA